MGIETNKIYQGNSLDVLNTFPDESVDCVVTSPPYWGLRDYGISGQLGHENNIEEYIENLCKIFDEIYRVLCPAGTCFINLGDTYSGSNRGVGDKTPDPIFKTYTRSKNIKPSKTRFPNKCLCMIPERFAIEMCNRRWILRNQIVWHKPNQLPSSAKDRFTVDFEKVFFFTKNKKYFFNQQFEPYKDGSDVAYRQWLRENKDYNSKEPYKNNSPFCHKVGHKAWDNDRSMQRGAGEKAIMRVNPNGRNKRTVWSIPTKPCKEAHFATFPEELIYPAIAAGCPENGIVLDPFMGAGTTAIVALKQNKNYVGIELSPDYIDIAEQRIKNLTKNNQLTLNIN
jgi:DNA modification methylase